MADLLQLLHQLVIHYNSKLPIFYIFNIHFTNNLHVIVIIAVCIFAAREIDLAALR